MSNQPPYPGSPEEPTRHGSGQPQNPYGQPQQGQPQNPYGQPQPGQPQQGNPYGQPQQGNPYGQPQQGQNPYGQPQQGNPYGQPQQGQNPYGQPQQGQNPYGQPQQGQQYGAPQQQFQQQYGAPQGGSGGGGSKKKILIPILLVVLIAIIAGGIFGVLALTGDDDSSDSVAISDLKTGQCLTSSDIADGEGTIGSIEETDCDESHDAEVFATYDLDEDQAKDFDIDAAGSQCVEELESAGVSFDDLTGDGNEVRPLVASDDPSEGDQVVCFIRNSDGESLNEQIVQ